ncbi:ferrous iron transport protein A [Candidatus Bathyarchaeota archaeon]|nr:MAG: ferrous iron transport protein A [Candidatus Bathyarchaeota archaeon]
MKIMRGRKRRRYEKKNPRNMENVVSLTSLHDGDTSVVAYTVGGFGLVRRLAEMGLTPGVRIKILRKGLLRGPFEIQVRGVSLALGYGVASRVFVRPLRE